MALPVYATWLANIQGPKGDDGTPGRSGTFDVATATTVPPEEPARAIISGEFGEIVEFEIPRGIPGVNGVPADSAMGTYVRTPGTQSRAAVIEAVAEGTATALSDPTSDATQAAAALFPVYRVWDFETGTYPARIEGAKNLFFGPVDPGLLADPDVDVWEPGDSTSLDSVVAAMVDTGSPLYAATRAATVGGRVPLELFAPTGTPITREIVGESPNRLLGWKFPQTSQMIFATTSVPPSWDDVRVRIRFMHVVSGGAGNVRFGCEIVPYAPGSSFSGVVLQNTGAAAASNVIKDHVFAGTNPVTPNGGVTVGIARLGGSGLDTFTGDIYILDAALERR